MRAGQLPGLGLEGFRASDLVVLERLRAVPDIVRRPGRVVKVQYSLK